jgi:hypothetical protein
MNCVVKLLIYVFDNKNQNYKIIAKKHSWSKFKTYLQKG